MHLKEPWGPRCGVPGVPAVYGCTRCTYGLWCQYQRSFAAPVPPIATCPCSVLPRVQGLTGALGSGCKEVAVFAAASEAFSRKNINCTVEESLKWVQHEQHVRGSGAGEPTPAAPLSLALGAATGQSYLSALRNTVVVLPWQLSLSRLPVCEHGQGTTGWPAQPHQLHSQATLFCPLPHNHRRFEAVVTAARKEGVAVRG